MTVTVTSLLVCNKLVYKGIVTVTVPGFLKLQSLFHLLVSVTVPVSLESQSLRQSIGVTVTVCSSLAEVNVPNLKQ